MVNSTVVGHGLDIVDLGEFSKLLTKPLNDHLDRHFTPSELDAAGEGAHRLQRLGGRFAAKEAVLKALGIGWGNGVAFTDIEVLALESGAPTISLSRTIAQLARERTIARWFVSISHTSSVSVASVIAIGES